MPPPEQASSERHRVAAASIAAGIEHTCALLTNGRVRCWGNGGYGQLGYGNTTTIGDNETPASAGNVPVGGKVTGPFARDAATCTGRVKLVVKHRHKKPKRTSTRVRPDCSYRTKVKVPKR